MPESIRDENTGVTWKIDEFGVARVSSPQMSFRFIVNSTNSKIMYIGVAAIASSESVAVWQITEYNTTSGVTAKMADGNDDYDNIWDNRESLTYS